MPLVGGFGGKTRLVFLAGDPIGHTKGYAEYAAAFAAAGIDAAYVPAHVPAGQLSAFLAGLRWVRNLAGVVATVPHKLAALEAGRPTEVARRAGSANVLRPGPDGWECTQVDGAGFLDGAEADGIPLAGKIVQVVGAGGAGRAVAMAIAERGPAALQIHDLDGARAQRLVADVRAAFPVAARASLEPGEVLVNCSTAGMGTDESLAVPPELIPRAGWVYDVVNRADTPLLRAAVGQGCRTGFGRSMMLAEIPLITRYLFETR